MRSGRLYSHLQRAAEVMSDLSEEGSCVEQKDSLADVITSPCLDELDYDELIEPSDLENNTSLLPVGLALLEEKPIGNEAEEGEISSDGEEGEIKGLSLPSFSLSYHTCFSPFRGHTPCYG